MTAPEPRDRVASRIVVRDRDGRVLLFRGFDPADPNDFYWFTPGGALEDGESFEDAAARELEEETGLVVTALAPPMREDVVEFPFEGVTYRQRQRYYLVEVTAEDAASTNALDRSRWTAEEVAAIAEARWWLLSDLDSSTERIYPADLAAFVVNAPPEAWGVAASQD